MFGGDTYQAERDLKRLAAQLARVRTLMLDRQWRSLRQIAQATDSPEASVSARLRDLRKLEFGAHTVERQHVGMGLYLYRLVPNTQPEPQQELFSDE